MLSKNNIDLIKALLYEANSVAKQCRQNGLEVSCKSDDSCVTNADIAIGKFLKSEIAKITPEIQIICEEEPESPKSDTFWLIDPIDGTNGYIHGDSLYAINVCLVIKNIPLYGFISVPESDHIYYNYDQDGIKIEYSGKDMQLVTNNQNKLKALISYEPLEREKSIAIIKKYNIDNYKYIPCSIKFCLIASGIADLYPRYGRTMEWDTAPGSALINASGGIILDMEGNTLSYGKENLENKGFIAYSKRLAEMHKLR
ncbi:MAG UNVERIFIED_CONTAM: 3'(2'),5'-bisphosphate nucleotidase CysQ [Rickettsiaceae bacterium]|jgi:3'(2'), 5'-bisphosphate nucleotidase